MPYVHIDEISTEAESGPVLTSIIKNTKRDPDFKGYDAHLAILTRLYDDKWTALHELLSDEKSRLMMLSAGESAFVYGEELQDLQCLLFKTATYLSQDKANNVSKINVLISHYEFWGTSNKPAKTEQMPAVTQEAEAECCRVHSTPRRDKRS